ncbi:MAG: hypothetical protein IT534_01170 [Bauldia sp.]|nr:hypothetical protein [Bauldia sp.]
MRVVRAALVVGLCLALAGCGFRPVRTCLDHLVVCAAGGAAAAGAIYLSNGGTIPDLPFPAP